MKTTACTTTQRPRQGCCAPRENAAERPPRGRSPPGCGRSAAVPRPCAGGIGTARRSRRPVNGCWTTGIWYSGSICSRPSRCARRAACAAARRVCWCCPSAAVCSDPGSAARTRSGAGSFWTAFRASPCCAGRSSLSSPAASRQPAWRRSPPSAAACPTAPSWTPSPQSWRRSSARCGSSRSSTRRSSWTARM